MNILKRIRYREIIIFLCILLLFRLSPLLQYIPIRLLNWDVSRLSSSQEIVLLTFSSLCLFVIYFIFYFKSLRKDLNTFKNDIMNNLNTAFKYWFVGLVIMFVSNIIIVFFNHNMAGNEQSVRQMIDVLPFFMLINAGFIAPFNEEIIFRKSLGDIFKSKWLFVFFSFLLFGGAHVIGNIKTWLDILYIIPYGALGGAFALAYRKTDTIITSIVMHMFHNTLMVSLLIFL